jgi:hypothetical protein
MKEVLEFVFSSWGNYLGTLLLVIALSKWNLVKVVTKSEGGVISQLAELGKAKGKEEVEQLNS